LAAVNLEQFIAALSPAVPQTALTAAPAVPPVAEAAAETVVTAPAPSTRGRSRGAARKAPAKKAATRSRKARAEKAAASVRESANGRRAYRRMPEGAEVAEIYTSAGTATAVAEHFGVPRHTASGWVRRLRSQGVIG
jgi:hypothetical protein